MGLWWNEVNLDIIGFSRHHILAEVKNDNGVLEFCIAGIYGWPENTQKYKTWELIDDLRSKCTAPMVLFGDFNEILSEAEKEGGQGGRKHMEEFRTVLDENGLRDLGYKGNFFTWQGRRANGLIRERLDRFVASLDWCSRFPNFEVSNFPILKSDHAAILLSTEAKAYSRGRRRFTFESFWLSKEQCQSTVQEQWNSLPGVPITEKIACCAKGLQRWAKTEFGKRREKIKENEQKLKELQKAPPSGDVLEACNKISTELETLYREEESYWHMRARSNELRDDDKNSAFFHHKATQRRRRNRITGLINNEGVWCSEEKETEKIVVDFFSKLFTSEGPTDFDDAMQGIKQVVNDDMNEALNKEPDAREIRDALFQMHPTKAPGPDGMHALFYQKFWHIIGCDVVHFIVEWWKGKVDLNEVNSTHIALIPKTKNPTRISEFRPISLCNVLYKIITKMLANRLKPFLSQIVSEHQSAFIPKRLITDNVLVALEVFHAMKRKVGGRRGYFALKLDMSKAYDRVEWSFVERVMLKMGFSNEWVNRILNCISSVRFSFIINGVTKGLILPSRGLRQGDPISPYIFILCAEAFSTLLIKAAEEKEIHGIQICRGAPSVSHLFFADDSILFGRANLSESSEIAEIIRRYEKASGQKINYDKSEISFSKNVDMATRTLIKQNLRVTEVDRHKKYLGLPTIIGRSKKAIFAGIKERIWKKLQGWKERLLSRPGKEVLIKAIAQAIPTNVMSIFKLPEGLVEDIHGMLAKFWWGSKEQERKIHWMRWEKLCMPKYMGGLGFRDLKVFNLAMLAKQGWRLINNTQSLLFKVYKAKYFKNSDFMDSALGFDPSFSWRSIWSAKSLLLEGVKWRVGNGAKINVWTDAWLPSRSSTLVPTPNLNADPNMTVAELIDQQNCCWNLRKISSLLMEADVRKILEIPLSNRLPIDELFWWPTKDGNFSTKSCYWLGKLGHLRAWRERQGTEEEATWKVIWSLEGPPKLQHFAWRAMSGVLAVKGNLRKRHIIDSGTCSLCNTAEEDLDHAIFNCTETALIWTGNNIDSMLSFCPGNSFKEKVCWLIKKLPKKETTSFFTLAWAAWNLRNALMFNESPVNSANMVRGLVRMVEDYKKYAERVFCRNGPRDVQSSSAWSPPPLGVMKVNTDAFCPNELWFGMGVVIRDDTGDLKAVATHRLEGKLSPTEAEAMAARFGLKIAQQLGFEKVILETDALTVISGCKQESTPRTPVGLLLSDIILLSRSFASIEFNHVKRGANSVAHLAARMYTEIGEELILSCNFPQGLRDLVAFDLS